jgi:hypothetical protein
MGTPHNLQQPIIPLIGISHSMYNTRTSVASNIENEHLDSGIY